MKANIQYSDFIYRESGIAGLPGQAIAIGCYLIITLFLGYIYAVTISIIPFIYANIFIAVTLATVIGLTVKLGSRLSQNRNKTKRIIHAAIAGLMIWYFQWIAYLTYAENFSVPLFDRYVYNLQLFFKPADFFSQIVWLNNMGPWSIGSFTFTGLPLALIWIGELLIFVGTPLIIILKTQVYPYSENTMRWFPKYTLFKDFESLPAGQYLMDELIKNPIEALQNLKKGDGLRHTKVHLYYLPQEDSSYLTFEKIYYENQGKGSRNADVILNNFKITRNQAESILSEFENNRERIDVI